MSQNQYAAYSSASINTAQKVQQVIMLYDSAIKAVTLAKEAVQKKDIQARYNHLTKACNIVTGLQLALDFDRGGEVAQILYDYYSGLDMRLLSIHMSNDVAMCDLCIKHLRMMRDAWSDVDQQQNGGGNTHSDMPSRSATDSVDSGSISMQEMAEAVEYTYPNQIQAAALASMSVVA